VHDPQDKVLKKLQIIIFESLLSNFEFLRSDYIHCFGHLIVCNGYMDSSRLNRLLPREIVERFDAIAFVNHLSLVPN
jgi:hypothetical protein